MIIILGGIYFIELRADFGILFLGWVICVVIVTDTFGYFGGRLIGLCLASRPFWPLSKFFAFLHTDALQSLPFRWRFQVKFLRSNALLIL